MTSKFPFIMKLTAAVSAIATAILAVCYHFFPIGGLLTAAISVGTVCYHFSMRLLIGAIIPIPKGSARWFRLRPWEIRLYRFLRVKHWKKHLPTYAPQLFDWKKLGVAQAVRNMCQAEIVHEIIIPCSFLPLLAVPFWGDFWVFFITSLLSALFDSLFVMAQRYNRPRLERLLTKQYPRNL